MKKIFVLIVSFLLFVPMVMSDSLNLSEVELIKYYGPVSLIIDMHVELGEGDQSDGEFLYYTNLLTEMSKYAELDIVNFLKTSINLEESLDYTLNNLHSLIVKGASAVDTLNQKMNVLVQTKTNCDESKVLSDKSYSLSLKDFKAKDMEQYLQQSLEYDKCASESRIRYNAYNKIIEQLQYYYEILQMKYSYFLENKYDIISNLSR